MPEIGKKWTILGQDPDILLALLSNVLSWFVSRLFPSQLPKLLPECEHEDTSATCDSNQTKCISIGRPGGLEQLRLVTLKKSICTKGYNVKNGSPFISMAELPSDGVVLHNQAFSINYADCCIRWGLYESAKQFVGWPIVPGFDVAGIVEQVGPECSEFKAGDRVFGCTLFGSYSSRVLIPKIQLRKIPKGFSNSQAASLPAVSLTALYALSLGGHFPSTSPYRNKAILIHSCAGGVGSMLVQMSKILGLSPVVGVVGSSAKVEAAKALGCDVVIDKSQDNLWELAEAAAPEGYATIMDANGVSTLGQSYEHLAPTGRVIVFGFHSNLPIGRAMLSPLEWLRMGKKMSVMPRFDAMDMVVSNKAVMGFNLSFFSEEKELVSLLFDQVCDWLASGELHCPRVVEMEGMDRIGEAHQLIMSGKSVGKIVVTT